MSRGFGLLLVLLSLVLCSCSGGTSAPAGINYVTDWTRRLTAGQITGLSQKVNILDSAGLPVTTQIVQNVAAPIETTKFDLPNGSYLIQVQLYSSANAAGTQTGSLEVPVTISNGSRVTVNSAVGDAVDAINVTPDQASVQVGRGKQFRAAGLNTSGIKTFTTPNSLVWSVLGGVGTVTTDGNFTSTAIGTGSVRALYTNGRSGSAAVTGTPPSATQGKWTVLVYMNGANDLQQYSVLNMNQMERVASNPDVRFVVQWKQFPAQFNGGTFNGTRRYLANSDFSNNINSTLLQDMGTSIDMGSPQTLNEFISWGKANFPADHYCLIVWNHGNGWRRSITNVDFTRAVSYDDETGNSIQIWDLNQALGSEHFDLISWDASLMQMMEVAYEIKDNADYIIGSEESPPAEGLPYDLVFAPFRDTPNSTPKNLSKSFVDGMLAVPAYNTKKITQSVLDTSKLPALATAISTLGTELKNNVGSLTAAIQTARVNSQAYSPSSNRVYRDLKDICLRIEAGTSNSSVLSATAGVKTAIADAVVWEGHNSNSINSSGISIDFSSGSTFASASSDYALMKLAIATQWNEYLALAP
ncbi:MAG: clostripain-related cysteine peptidase [Armatimonadota bacterium]